jgi:hypothetical protein
MAGRGENLFKRNDVMRAIKSVTDAGLPVAGVEIVCKDGTVIKLFGASAAQMQATQESAAAAKAWVDATEAIAKSKKAPRGAPTRRC